jgi:hypothetical protein
MAALMLAVRKSFQVLRPVVEFIAVLVVNVFRPTATCLSEHEAVVPNFRASGWVKPGVPTPGFGS